MVLVYTITREVIFSVFSYYMPTRVIFGAGCIEKLATEKLPGKKALIVLGGSSMKRLGYLDRVKDLLKKQGIECLVFDKVLPNPIRKHVTEGAAIARENGCDFIIGLGGGSSIDSAKAIAFMAKNSGDFWDYVQRGTGGRKPPESAPLPVVAISTTAGTGTEADPDAVMSNEDTNEKIGLSGEFMFPKISIVDPEMMVSIPPDLTAYQGFDVFFHSMEGYIATNASPMSDMFAIKSIELIAKFLPMAVADGNNVEARSMVALANLYAGIVETMVGCLSQHSLEHALSAYHPKIAHGAGLIMLSLAYNAFFCDKIPDKYVDMARVMGISDAGSSTDFLKALARLQMACGVNDLKMSSFGIDNKNWQKYVDNAVSTMGHLFRFDPAKLSNQDMIDIFENSYR